MNIDIIHKCLPEFSAIFLHKLTAAILDGTWQDVAQLVHVSNQRLLARRSVIILIQCEKYHMYCDDDCDDDCGSWYYQ